MSKIAKLSIEKDILTTLNVFFKEMLAKNAVEVLVVPQDLPSGHSTVQTLVKDAEKVISANPFAFVLPSNSAGILVKTTDDASQEKIVAVFRPCEMRAVFELAKLHQVNLDNVTLISADCMGTLPLPEYTELAKNSEDDLTLEMLAKFKKDGKAALEEIELRTACQICEFPVFESADISIGIIGVDSDKEMILKAHTAKGEELLSSLGLELVEEDEPESRKRALEELAKARQVKREELVAQIKEAVNTPNGYITAFAGCIKCHNCMNVCPICYCKECFFDSEMLTPSPRQYMDKGRKRGVVRMPIDTVLYHIGRMNHMITSCVSCGMCESACPSKIPLLAIYHALGADVQELFDYVAGRNLEEELPLATFKEEELEQT